MNIAIEFGGSEFRSLRREAGRLLARRVSTEYLVLEDSKARRRLLERHGDEVAHCDQGMIVYGSAANDLAEILSLPMQSALDDGRIRSNDPVSRQFLGALVEGLIPPPAQQDATCTVISSQAARNDEDPALQEDLGFLLRLVKLRGYQPSVISPGMGLILSECADIGFSGIAVKMGAARMDVSIVYQTRELTRFFLPRGGIHVDRQLAVSDHQFVRLKDGREVLDTRPIRLWREGVKSLNSISDSRMLELRNQYREIIRLGLYRMRQELNPSLMSQIPGKLPLIIGGPMAGPSGIERLFQEAIDDVDLPIQIKSVRRVQDVAFSVLRGGLIAGELEHPDLLSSFAA